MEEAEALSPSYDVEVVEPVHRPGRAPDCRKHAQTIDLVALAVVFAVS